MSGQPRREVVVLGCSGAGKTILIRRICAELAPDSDPRASAPLNPESKPTTGVELNEVVISGREVILREVGAAMIPIWPSFYQEAAAFVFVVDIGRDGQLLSAADELARLVANEKARGKPILVVATKSDCFHVIETATLQDTLMIADLNRELQAEAPAAPTSPEEQHKQSDEEQGWSRRALDRAGKAMSHRSLASASSRRSLASRGPRRSSVRSREPSAAAGAGSPGTAVGEAAPLTALERRLPLTLVEASAFDGVGVADIVHWISDRVVGAPSHRSS